MNIYLILGKSAAGKDTLLAALKETLDINLTPIVSYTTRPMRPGEVNHIDYHFVDLVTFMDKLLKGEFIEYRSYSTTLNGKYNTWYYGTDNSINEDSIGIVDLDGLLDIKEYYKNTNTNVISIYLDVPDDVRNQRAHQRPGFCEAEWNRRLVADDIAFQKVQEEVDFIITDNSVSTFLSVI